MAGDKSGAVIRLTTEVYNDLEKKVVGLTSQVPKNELEAGFALGVQHVLKYLRTGYVVGS